jgi:hypothetical protein
MQSEDGLASVPASAPPTCPDHPGSKVTRNGTYGVNQLRQRYRCTPEGEASHQFTPPLSREVVTPGDECARCDELLSPHHGRLTAARSTTWTLVGVAQALSNLSLGQSYADVSLGLRAQRDAASEHLQVEHGVIMFTRSATTAATVAGSYSRRQRRNAWRVAADLVEQYSPPLFATVDAQFRREAQLVRDGNDAALAADPNALLERPIVYVLDELPVWTATGAAGTKRPTWNILTVVETRYQSTPDPFGLPERDTRLRLARAFPRSNADAWQLVLDELGVRPDVVVADAASGLQGAVTKYYGGTVGVIPSMWHMHSNIRDMLLKLKNTTYQDGKEAVLIDPLTKHLSQLARADLLNKTPADVTTWWTELESMVAGLRAPVAPVRALRDIHEPRLLAALPILQANPHVPASNAAVENRIRVALKPFLVNRAHLFGNGERTNRLLNLLVCREAGLFNDMDALTLRLRQMNEASGGWAAAPRQILDKQTSASKSRTQRYESLKSHAVIAKVAKAKQIPTAAETLAATPPPLLSKQRPATLENLPIRDWARSLGLPGSPTGPIKPSVQLAYNAHLDGTSDDDVIALYREAERTRMAEKKARRRARVSAKEEAARTLELAPLRAWAAEQGIDLAANGQISDAVRAEYDAFVKGSAVTARPSKRAPRSKP